MFLSIAFDDEETNKPDTTSTVSSGLDDALGLDDSEEGTEIKQETDPVPSSSSNSKISSRNEEEEPFSSQEVISAMLGKIPFSLFIIFKVLDYFINKHALLLT